MKSIFLRVAVLVFCCACVDRLPDSLAIEDDLIVIDGHISDQPGPYKIRIFKSVGSESNVLSPPYVRARSVTIFDNNGNSELLTEMLLGEYKNEVEYWSKPDGIRGQVGRKYWLRVELLNGVVIQSEPDQLLSVGEITDVRFAFNRFKPLNGPTEYGFKVFMDAENSTGHVRWRFNGTYLVETFPQFRHWPIGACIGSFFPPPCSGYESPDGISLNRVGDCTCCTCWVTDNESKPLLSDDEILTDGAFKNVEVGYVPFNVWRFNSGRYLVKVEQMSLTDEAYEYWKIIRDQKEGTTSLFQPSIGKIGSNFSSSNPDLKVAGFFYATAIKEKAVFISSSDSEIPVPEYDRPGEEVCLFWDVCDAVWLNASRTPPPEWED